MNTAIVARRVWKSYRRYDPHRPKTLHEALTRGFRRLRPRELLWALRDVSFAVPRGRGLALLGHNGAGKSTLLRLLGGVGRPDAGSVRVRGRIGALLEIGAGFHPDLTGEENVEIGGVVNGLSRRQVRERFDSIVAFAELEEFIGSPLRTYSTGMWMRLAFSVAVHVEPEILLVDEVLSVGDLRFQQKCLERIRGFRDRGCALVIATHELELVRSLCDSVAWLDGGRLVMYGPAGEVADRYVEAGGRWAEP